MSRGFSLIVLVVYALAVAAHAEDHSFFPKPGLRRIVGENSPVSPKLTKFLTDEFLLREDFVKGTDGNGYAQRVSNALKDAREGNPEEIVKVSLSLLDMLTEGKKQLLDLRMKEVKGSEKSDADLDDLIKWLQTVRKEKVELSGAKRQSRIETQASGPKSVQDFMNLIKQEAKSIRDRFGCYKRCEGFKDWDLTDAVCYQACQYAFPRN